MFSLTTDRLILRNLQADDWRAFHTFSADPVVTRFIDWIRCDIEAESQEWLARASYHNQLQPRQSYNLGIVRQTDDRLIGWLGIGGPNEAKAVWGDLDFGYALNQQFWGQGYMTEALRALLDFCFTLPGITKIFGECNPANIASARVMEKAGLTLEAQGAESLRYAIKRDS